MGHLVLSWSWLIMRRRGGQDRRGLWGNNAQGGGPSRSWTGDGGVKSFGVGGGSLSKMDEPTREVLQKWGFTETEGGFFMKQKGDILSGLEENLLHMIKYQRLTRMEGRR